MFQYFQISVYKKIVLTLLPSCFLLFSFGAPININTADIPTIVENLKDIGPVKATAIVEYRQKNGAFKTVNDLLSVKGIGDKTLQKNIDNLIFDIPSMNDDTALETAEFLEAKTES
ncbi:ComEA family DNA-binding protein [Ignatzschineria sp. LJL83]